MPILIGACWEKQRRSVWLTIGAVDSFTARQYAHFLLRNRRLVQLAISIFVTEHAQLASGVFQDVMRWGSISTTGRCSMAMV
jgi:hypothetical protein